MNCGCMQQHVSRSAEEHFRDEVAIRPFRSKASLKPERPAVEMCPHGRLLELPERMFLWPDEGAA